MSVEIKHSDGSKGLVINFVSGSFSYGGTENIILIVTEDMVRNPSNVFKTVLRLLILFHTFKILFIGLEVFYD